jgi:hypothetical protein
MTRIMLSLVLLTGVLVRPRTEAVPPAPAQGRGTAQPAPELMFRMTLQNQTRLPLTQDSVTTPNVDLQL